MHRRRPLLENLDPRLMLSFDPSPQEQEMLELINRMRTDPSAELSKLVQIAEPLTSTDPDVTNALRFFRVNSKSLQQQWSTLQSVQPLAWNDALSRSAATHNELMVENDTQSHYLPGERSLIDRIRVEGYGTIGNMGGSFSPAESVYAYGTNVFQTHAAFAIDWGGSPLDTNGDGIQDPPGHRNAMMRADFREVGVDYREEYNDDTDVGPALTTIHFGSWTEGSRPELDDPYLLGVAYNDLDADNTYDAGEGLSGVTVRISGPDGTVSTTSLSAGGWQQRVSTVGTYTVTFEGAGVASPVTFVRTVGTQNIKVDLNLASIPATSFSVGPDQWLYVRGTDGPDAISFELESSLLKLVINNIESVLPFDTLAGIQVNSYLGDDSVQVSPQIVLATRIQTGQGNDTVYGGSGDDHVIARLGDDVVYGGAGNDTLMTGQGNDFIGGGSDRDVLFGGQGNDTLFGGGGDDLIDARDGDLFVDLVIGGAGEDQATIDVAIDDADAELFLA